MPIRFGGVRNHGRRGKDSSEVGRGTRRAIHGDHLCASIGTPRLQARPIVVREAAGWLLDPVPCCAQFSSSNTLYSALEFGHPADRSGHARSTRERTLPSCVREIPGRAFQADHLGVAGIRNPSREPFGGQKAPDPCPCSGPRASSGFVAPRPTPLLICDSETRIGFPLVNDLVIAVNYASQHCTAACGGESAEGVNRGCDKLFYAEYVDALGDSSPSSKLVSDDQATIQRYDDRTIPVVEILTTPANKSFAGGGSNMDGHVTHKKIGSSSALRVRCRKTIVGYWLSGQPTVERSTDKML